jgi:hypothetical protein
MVLPTYRHPEFLGETNMKHRLLRYFGQPGNSWRYALAHDYGFHTKYLRDVHFKNKWLTIKDGDVVIKAGYAWDGCSPCVSVLGLFYLGPPDGAQLPGIPATYHASLVHDALCQFRHDLPISKATSVAIFRELLDKTRFPLARLYATAVALFGPRNFRLGSSLPQRIRASRRKRIPQGSGA